MTAVQTAQAELTASQTAKSVLLLAWAREGVDRGLTLQQFIAERRKK